MSKIRTFEEINQEYYQVAAQVGDLCHKVWKFTGEIPYEGTIIELHNKLQSIDKEADLLQKMNKTKSADPKMTLKENEQKERQEPAVM